jgi:Mlc titration factor MtfA (ptsG expression regulator)
MIFAWLKKLRRQRLVAKPFPRGWLRYLQENVGFYSLLTDAERAKLRDDLRVFVAEKNWEGCGGLTLTDEMKVTIAAQACLLLLGIQHDYFNRVLSVLVYPSEYVANEKWVGPDGVVHEGKRNRLGEAWNRGPVVLGWDAVIDGSKNYKDGLNVVLHEFAHQLDFLDGLVNGTPPLKNREQYRKWHEVMTAEYNQLVKESEEGIATLLDQYGTTNPGEFFAVATECFFEQPVELQRRHARLYRVLRDYYCQDTVERFTRGQMEER